MQNFADRLKAAIEKSGKPKGDLAAHCGVALSTVSRWLSGSEPNRDTVAKISHFLEINPIWLLTGVDQYQIFKRAAEERDGNSSMLREDAAPYRIERPPPNQSQQQMPNEQAAARPVEERVDRLEMAMERMALAIERLAIAMETRVRNGGGND